MWYKWKHGSVTQADVSTGLGKGFMELPVVRHPRKESWVTLGPKK